MDKLRNEVQEVFCEVFGDDTIVLTDELTAEDVPGWDSMGNLNLMIALEQRFGIKFATAEISRLKEDGQNAGALLALIARKRG